MELSAYDKLPYPSHTYPQTHPDRLATIATLCGMNPAPVESCRVLELGCGAGGNLVSFAFDLKQSELTGVDLASLPISEGNALIAELGLKNITLSQVDLMELSEDLGEFDYIIAHGLYSWVPNPAQDRILAICATHLAKQGVAYISYNAYPGGHLREISRDMMLFHTSDILEPKERLEQSRAVIRWAAEAQFETDTYATWLREFDKRLQKRSDGSFYHDDLAEINTPVYFHHFAKHAAEHGLQFLSEADYFETENYCEFPSEVRAHLDQMALENLLAKEQYLDFLNGRSFRQTLLCRHDVALDRPVKSERINGMYIKSSALPTSPTPDLKSKSIEEFRTKKDAAATTDLPLAKAALLFLGEIHPRGIRFEELTRRACELAGKSEPNNGDDAQTLAEVILRSFSAGVVELHLHEPTFSVEAGTFPLASPLARWQARRGDVVTTLLHESLRIADNLALQLIQLLDGTRDRGALSRELSSLMEANMESSDNAAEFPAEKESLLSAIPQQLEQKLAELGKLGLLLA
jgi:methyltransferase-like protein/cyclopropane fatty-acyl-phospholipid synthase-like methyltransferase